MSKQSWRGTSRGSSTSTSATARSPRPLSADVAPPPELDLLVLGSGVAGLTAAISAAAIGLRVGVLTKGELSQSATRWAQGGVAAVLSADEDSTDFHLADTLA